MCLTWEGKDNRIQTEAAGSLDGLEAADLDHGVKCVIFI